MAPAARESTPLLHAGDEREAGDNVANRWRLADDDKAISYTVFTEMATMPTLLFSRFHMLMFIEVLGLRASQVAAAQVIFCVWNLSNVLLAGRIVSGHAAKYGSILGLLCAVQLLWNVAACLPFADINAGFMQSSGGTLYYLACICLYDAFLSLAGVARPVLLGQISQGEEERVHFKRWSSLLGNVEALAPLVGYGLWSATAPGRFRLFLGGTTLVATGCNCWSAARLAAYVPERPGKDAEGASPPVLLFLRSLSADVWVYIAVFSLHELQSALHGQYAALVIETWLAESGHSLRVAALASLSTVSGLVCFAATWVATRHGVYEVILWTFRLKVSLILAIVIWGAIDLSAATVCVLLFVGTITMDLLTYFSVVLVVNLMDDMDARRRAGGASHPLAGYANAFGPALLASYSAFFVKPWGSAGTVLGAWALAGDAAAGEAGRARAFAILAGAPLLVGLAQLALWQRGGGPALRRGRAERATGS